MYSSYVKEKNQQIRLLFILLPQAMKNDFMWDHSLVKSGFYDTVIYKMKLAFKAANNGDSLSTSIIILTYKEDKITLCAGNKERHAQIFICFH